MATYQKIANACGSQAKLVVVSKKRTLEEILFYYNLGIRDFGENRVDELVYKAKQLPQDIHWHFIGHLQRNKVKTLLPYVYLIHSVASIDLCKVIEKEALKLNRKIPVLVQINIAEESTKTGLFIDDVPFFLEKIKEFTHLDLYGLMCMGPHVEDVQVIDTVFRQAHVLFETIKESQLFSHFNHLSMGMSNDYEIALKNKATLLRIGSLLFEEIKNA